ncbi:MAG: hypothetical protein RIR79_502 [Pseudomonadota bacterium]|jgi:TolC family type I secretion outer membrane protein
MTMMPKKWIFLLGSALLTSSAWALNLSQAYEAALAHDASLKATQAATSARQERLPQARSQLLPNIGLSASRNRNELETTQANVLGQPLTSTSSYGSGNTTLTLRQPLFRKQQWADYEQAQFQVADANAVLERETQNLAVRVSGAYCEALQAKEGLNLILAQRTSTTAQWDAAKKRFAAGLGTRTDVDEAQAALDLNAAQELEARQNIAFTQRQLQVMLGNEIQVATDELRGLDAAKLPLNNPTPNDLDTWIERALENSPEVRSQKAQLESARLDVEKAQSGHYPTLDAVAQWSRSESENVTNVNSTYTNRSVGLQLTIPIYAGGQTSSQVRQALSEQERATQALQALQQDIAVRVHREFRGITEGVLKIRAIEQAVRSTDQVALSTRRSYEAGVRTLNDTLNAEQQHAAARRDLSQARLVYLLSHIRLLALTGAANTEAIQGFNAWLK